MNETPSDQDLFKNYLRKIGSGIETSREMSREESANALELMLKGIPSPAQIGAFLIAHRIRRPEPQELAGMIDTYLKLGPKIYSNSEKRRPICFGMPFDGRNKTSPLYPLTTILLIEAGQPVVLQCTKRIPVKYGNTVNEFFNALGLNLTNLPLEKVQDGFLKHGLALIYQPDHFPIAEKLISYRQEIGKRPPIASMELIWTAHQGEHLIISGFVHPPTEERHIQALNLLGETNLIMIKGLEGSIDLPISRSTTTTYKRGESTEKSVINPRTYFCSGKDQQLVDLESWKNEAMQALMGTGPLYKALLLNAGVYFYYAGLANDIEKGIERAKKSIEDGKAQRMLKSLISWRNIQ